MPKISALIIALLVVTASTAANALTIVTNFTGGTPISPIVGTGTIEGVFTAAAAQWERAIRDSFTLTLNYGWSTMNYGGTHTLNAQGGIPNRETLGTILFDSQMNDGWSYFMDATPTLADEFFGYREYSADLGGGVINTGRNYYESTVLPNASIDLFSLALHEIGHALGNSMANSSWQQEALMDGDIDVTAPLAHAGTTVQLATNYYGINSNFADMGENVRPVMGGGSAHSRSLLSELDILAIGQLGHFTYLDYNPYDNVEPVLPPETTPVPEPSTWALTTVGLLITLTWVRRRSQL